MNQTPTITFPMLLLLLFVGLKLCGVISWSWLWVLSPFWLPIALVFAVCVMFFIIGVLTSVIHDLFK